MIVNKLFKKVYCCCYSSVSMESRLKPGMAISSGIIFADPKADANTINNDMKYNFIIFLLSSIFKLRRIETQHPSFIFHSGCEICVLFFYSCYESSDDDCCFFGNICKKFNKKHLTYWENDNIPNWMKEFHHQTVLSIIAKKCSRFFFTYWHL